ncbi:Arv1-domain-containing protein [Gymnopus androsaceus JB14]|uniref:Protein ARV n=1 Tax=Gymnopus androsaceus JB14 TaxID=1447944 RepID=A0A6A4GGY0_9AGAR|nr:Arv1-domain-containing protein [Gymnopus androsaceus JB14]
MPVCTTCTQGLPFLYTVYQSAYNLRLEQCPNCHNFADPYVEHDELTLLIDLLLLKRAVYRHLLYNRGSEPRREDGTSAKESLVKQDDLAKELSRWGLVLRLGLTLTFVDAFIRWSHFSVNPAADVDLPSISPWAIETISEFAMIFLGCCTETIAFHGGIVLTSYIVLRVMDLRFWRVKTDIHREFRLSLIPLALFYSSFTKLFFLFLLTIWRPSRTSQPPSSFDGNVFIPLPFNLSFDILGASEWMLDANLDKEWLVRNILGGMSAGFGLRVILDIHPLFTTSSFTRMGE